MIRLFPYGAPPRHCIVPGCTRLTAYHGMLQRYGPGVYAGSDRRYCRAHYRRMERGRKVAGRVRKYERHA